MTATAPLGRRFQELADMRDGWLEPTTPAPSAAFLARAEAALGEVAIAVGVCPHVFPTPRGGVQAEWDGVDLEIAPAGNGLTFEGIAAGREGVEDLDPTSDVAAAARWAATAVGVS